MTDEERGDYDHRYTGQSWDELNNQYVSASTEATALSSLIAEYEAKVKSGSSSSDALAAVFGTHEVYSTYTSIDDLKT
jgi:hypothetical protein